MSLQELEDDLQKRESEVIKRQHDTTEYDVWRSQEKKMPEKSDGGNWQKIKDRMGDVRVRGIVIGGIVLAVITFIAICVVSFALFQKGFFAQERVELAIESAKMVDSNKLIEVTFVYENDNRATLENAEITVGFGNYFVPAGDQNGFTKVSDSQGIIRIGTINGHEEGQFVLAGYFAGPTGSINALSGTLRYVPEKTSVRYETVARSTTTITSSPVVIDVESPTEIVNGNLMDIVFRIKNMSSQDLNKLKFIVDMPQTFSFYAATPQSNHENVWLIEHMQPKTESTIVVRGSINAAVGTTQKFSARVISQETSESSVEYASISYAPRMTQSPIMVSQALTGNDGTAEPGERLSYMITFTNDSPIALRDAIITVNLDSVALDYARLELLDGGDYDQENRRITWKASDVPILKILEPHASGKVRFIVPVVENLPVHSDQDFHFSTSSIASIDSDDIPSELRENKTVLSNVLTIPVSAKIGYDSKVTFKEGSKQLKIGEKTVYTVNVRFDSINNDVDNVTVHIPLPTHVSYEGNADRDTVKYNERTNELTWNIGKVLHGAGVVRDAERLSFDVSVTPSIDQVQSRMPIISEQRISGTDIFTKKTFDLKGKIITSDDSDQSSSEKVVQP